MDIQELYTVCKKTPFIFSTDTRTISGGAIFVGIKGDLFDGNAYCQEAIEKGASYVISTNPDGINDPRILTVTDPLLTLHQIATLYRKEFIIPFLVIGGSNGKTTTKELIHAVLSKKYTVHTTQGNLNNHIGVPLTILQTPKNAEIAIIEMGANHPHEHTVLMDIVQPTHILVTNNGADHLEGFGSLDGVRKANKEIFDKAGSAHAFINKNLSDLVEDSVSLPRTLYPTAQHKSTSSLFASLIYKDISFTSSLFGSFNEANMLAAITVGEHFTVPLPYIQEAIASYEPSLKRSQVIQKEDHMIILDCYNANPTSMELSLKDYFAHSEAGKRIVIVGDMLEGGETEDEAHEVILQLIKEQKNTNDIIICVGKRFGKYQKNFSFNFFSTALEARGFLHTIPFANKKIFLKASRGIRLEEIL
jgi:UDP-N-acetylmuramoyl-tripeptide--D-alanyl-D-alanine ligase